MQALNPVFRLFHRIPRLVLAIFAIGSALGGEYIAELARQTHQDAPPLVSWLLFALAGLLLTAAGWPAAQLPAAHPPSLRAVLAELPQRRLFAIPLALALALNLFAMPLFFVLNSNPDPAAPARPWIINTGSWLLWIASLIAYGVAWALWEANTPASPANPEVDPPGGLLPRRIEWLLIGGLLLLALALRVTNLDSLPPGLWFDEAQDGNVARRLLSTVAAHVTFIGDAFTQKGMLDLYFSGLLLQLFGNDVWPVRLVAALSGSLVAPLLYLLAARLYGWRVGLAAGGLVALSVWNITFSRFSPGGLMFTVVFDVAAYLCFYQALRSGRLGYFAASGVLLGLGLHAYYPAKFAFVVLLGVLLHRLYSERKLLLRQLAPGLIAFGLGVVLAFMPVGLFAIQNWSVYNSRVTTVNIFSPAARDGLELGAALLESVRRHLLMFNWVGDRNGRHNIPGAPMLDPLSAALLLAGLAYCLLRWRRWQYFYPLLWFVTAMLGGILSLLYEAPQGARTVENSVVTALIGGIFLGEAWGVLSALLAKHLPTRAAVPRLRAGGQPAIPVASTAPAPLRWARRRGAQILGVAGIIVSLVAVGTLTIPRYFVTQVNNRGVWQDMEAPEANAARLLAQYGASADVYAGQYYIGLNHESLLAPAVHPNEWHGMEDLPLDPSLHDALLLLDPSEAADLQAIAAMYPHSSFEPLLVPSDKSGAPLMWTVKIPAQDRNALQGVQAALTQANGIVQKLAQPGMELSSEVLGGASQVRLASTLKVGESANYVFSLDQPAGGSGLLLVDGFAVAPGSPITLGIGLHSLALTATLPASTAATPQHAVRLLLSRPGQDPAPIASQNLFDPRKVAPHGLSASYRAGSDFDAAPKIRVVDPLLSHYYHRSYLYYPFSAEWQGKLYVPETGDYILAVKAAHEADLRLDDRQVLPSKAGDQESSVTLTAGLHDIRVRFISESTPFVYIYWQPPGRPRSIIPSAFLLPIQASYAAPDGGWPTLAQSDGADLAADRINGEKPVRQPAAPPQATAVIQAPELTPVQLAVIDLRALPDGAAAEPRDVAVDSAGNFYVASGGDNLIRKYSPGGKLLTSWGNSSPTQKVFEDLFGIALAADGSILALDAEPSKILRFDSDGQQIGAAITTGAFRPRGISVTPSGDILIANTGGGAILRLNSKGERVASYSGSAADPFAEPIDAVATTSGDIYTFESGKALIRWLSGGVPVAEWSIPSAVPARDNGHLALDSQNRLFATMPQSGDIVIFSPTGTALARWREPGLTPTGIFIDAADNVYVTFPKAGRVIKYGPMP